MVNEVTKKYYSRMATEGFLNAFICSLGVGFGALLISAFAFWMTGFEYPWVGFIVMGVVAAAVMPLFYYKKFRPSKKTIAQRVDELGLKERLLTMVELENDDSYIAQRQREDARAAIEAISDKFIKIIISTPAIVLASILAVTSGAMLTVAWGTKKGIFSSGKDLLEEVTTPLPIEYEVEFVEVGNGVIDGDLFQLVEEGQPIAEVVAIPDPDWFVYQWVYEIDGVEQILEETDVFYVEGLTVNQNMLITVVFAELTESENGGGSGEGESEGAEEEGESEPVDGEEDESEDGEDQETPPSDSDGEGGDQAGGKPNENHTVNDGKTDYGGEVYDNAVEDARGELEGDDEIPGDLKDIIGDYFDNIQK